VEGLMNLSNTAYHCPLAFHYFNLGCAMLYYDRTCSVIVCMLMVKTNAMAPLCPSGLDASAVIISVVFMCGGPH